MKRHKSRCILFSVLILVVVLNTLILFHVGGCGINLYRSDVFILLADCDALPTQEEITGEMKIIRTLIPGFVSVDWSFDLVQIVNSPLIRLSIWTPDREKSDMLCRQIVEEYAKMKTIEKDCRNSSDP